VAATPELEPAPSLAAPPEASLFALRAASLKN